jgi:hypothetical protein
MSIHDDELRVAYENGKAIGEYNIDVELIKQSEHGDVDAIETLAARSRNVKLRI